MNTLTNQFENLDITENSRLGKDLSAERGFVDEFEEKLKELNLEKINLLHRIGKAVMCITFEGESLPNYDDTFKIIKLTEETFVLKRKLSKIGWCPNYMQDKGYNETTPRVYFSFVYINHLPNRRAQGDHIVEFEPCKCFFLNSQMHFTLNYLVTSNGRKKRSKN